MSRFRTPIRRLPIFPRRFVSGRLSLGHLSLGRFAFLCLIFGFSAFGFSVFATLAPAAQDGWITTDSLIGESKYESDFAHYDYVNPNAPKGGILNSAAVGTFDSFNPFIVKGTSAAGLNYFGGLLWDTLMEQSADEPSVSHPLIARDFKYPADYSSATYRLHREARWHDGKPITAEDVKWTMNILKEHSPNHVRYFANVTDVKILGEKEVMFVFDQKGNRELPHIMGDLPVLPKHWWQSKNAKGEARDFTRTTLEAPLGSGPYRISRFETGSFIEWELVDDYWARDLPVRKGRFNFGKRVYRYFGDENAVWQAFIKGGLADVRAENRAQRWAQEYDFPAFEAGDVIRATFEDSANFAMVGWVMNQRRAIFKDRRTREALAMVLNFEHMNETLFFNQYKRTNTFFGGGELSSSGLPRGREKEILETYRGRIDERVFTEEFSLPVYKSRKDERLYFKRAIALLESAGWRRQGAEWVDAEGAVLKFEILGSNPSWERVHAPWINALRKLGVKAEFRVVDQSQFIQRSNNFDYDVIVSGALQSASPGNEQRGYWSSAAADDPGARNVYGLKDPVIDDLVEKIIAAPDRAELVAATRALDRLLLFRHLLVPQWYVNKSRLAWWDKFVRPEKQPTYTGYDLESWWIDPQKEAALAERN